ncbi:Crp/Fnr family transcriptional regulator [Actinoallomurus sp. NBC_01490]|uniref:Crp/Fnr family transcriptional regulator n=1 Tax=Actinoallomurus sp. NBC_01490 TaxID=2903557 RepID=UPI002E302751|nr:Crp/Fnr family transcriptional regulator [Actinoallomurus sp. NBC_01490]
MQMEHYGDGFLERLDWRDEIALWSKADFANFDIGDRLLAAGVAPKKIYFIRQGLVQMTAMSRDGQEAFLRLCGPGQMLGEDALLPFGQRSHRRRTVNATALTECRARVMSREGALEFLNSRPHLWEMFTQDLIQRTVEDETRITSLACDHSVRRLAWLLWDLERHGGVVQDDGSRRLPLPLSQTTLAMWAGMSKKTVERTLRDWRERGIISTPAPRTIIIHKSNTLAVFAGVTRPKQHAPGTMRQVPHGRNQERQRAG